MILLVCIVLVCLAAIGLLVAGYLSRITVWRYLMAHVSAVVSWTLAGVCGAAAAFCLGMSWQMTAHDADTAFVMWLLWLGLALLFFVLMFLFWFVRLPVTPKAESQSHALVVYRPPANASRMPETIQRVGRRLFALSVALIGCAVISLLLTWGRAHERFVALLPDERVRPTPTVSTSVPTLWGALSERAPSVQMPEPVAVGRGASTAQPERLPPVVSPTLAPPPIGGPLNQVTPPPSLVNIIYPSTPITIATNAATHPPELYVMVQAAYGANLRAAPSTAAAIVTVATAGERLSVIGQTADSRWIQVRLAENQDAWVHAGLTSAIQTQAP